MIATGHLAISELAPGAQRRMAKIEARLGERSVVVEDGMVVAWRKGRRRDWIERQLDRLAEAEQAVDREWLLEVSRAFPALLRTP